MLGAHWLRCSNVRPIYTPRSILFSRKGSHSSPASRVASYLTCPKVERRLSHHPTRPDSPGAPSPSSTKNGHIPHKLTATRDGCRLHDLNLTGWSGSSILATQAEPILSPRCCAATGAHMPAMRSSGPVDSITVISIHQHKPGPRPRATARSGLESHLSAAAGQRPLPTRQASPRTGSPCRQGGAIAARPEAYSPSPAVPRTCLKHRSTAAIHGQQGSVRVPSEL
jgi:hypothetical protein